MANKPIFDQEQADSLLKKGMISPETHASILGGMNDALVGKNNPEFFDRMRSGNLNPADVLGVASRGYDSLVGAPTRAAIAAGAKGENPIIAAAGQFGRNPDDAPDFGPIGNAVADPFVIQGAGKGLVRAGASMLDNAPQILGNEMGAAGKNIAEVVKFPNAAEGLPRIGADNRGGVVLNRNTASKVRKAGEGLKEIAPPTAQEKMAEAMMARYGSDEKLLQKLEPLLEKIKNEGEFLPPYLNLAEGQKPAMNFGGKPAQPTLPVPNMNYKIQNGEVGKPLTSKANFLDDPLNWMDQKYGAVKQALEKAEGPVNIHTAQDLIAHDDYLNVLPQGSKVNFYYNSKNQFGSATPGSASFKRLQGAVEKLKENGVEVTLTDTARGRKNVAPLPDAFRSTSFEKATSAPTARPTKPFNPKIVE